MQPTPAFGYEQIVQEMMRGLLDTVANRPDLSPQRQVSLKQTTVCTVMAYNPRDPIETMMAGQCVVYDHLMRDGARDLLRGQAEPNKLKARPGVLSAGKTFLAAMSMLLRMQDRPEHSLAFARPLPEAEEWPAPVPAMAPAAPADTMDPAAPPPEPGPQPQPVAADPGPGPDKPAPGQPADAGCEASPGIAAMTAAPLAPAAVVEAARPRSAEPGGGTPAAMPREVAAARIGEPGAAIVGAPGVARIAPARHPVGAPSGPPVEVSPDAEIRRMPLDCLDPAEQREIRDAMARMTRAAGRGVA
jgi:hypothetical protein